MLIRLLCLVVLAALFLPVAAAAGEPVKVHFFLSLECPHCKAEKAFLQKLQQKYPEIEIVSHVVTENPDEARLFVEMSQAYGAKLTGVPATFIGDFPPVFGFISEGTTGIAIETMVKNCIEKSCPDPIERVVKRPALLEPAPSEELLLGEATTEESVCPEDIPCIEGAAQPEEEVLKPTEPAAVEPLAKEEVVKEPPETEVPIEGPDVITLPLIGTVEASKMALPVLTVTIAALDGFNPCAFFVLFMLLGMLVHVRSRGRMLLVGGIFVFFSGFIYFIFMAAWLNIFLFAGTVRTITIVAGMIALVFAVINIKEFFFFRLGVSLSIPETAKPKLFDRMRKLLKATSLPSLIIGTVVLAVAANAYELLCTAGFPMVFTRVLTLHNLQIPQYYLYLVLYNVVYVVPLAVIVLLFTATLGSRKLSEHHGQILKLISGMMMLFLALVILIKPALLGNVVVAAGLLFASLAISGAIILVSRALHKAG
jgi:thiol-disulfide isomerase/thioredoxin